MCVSSFDSDVPADGAEPVSGRLTAEAEAGQVEGGRAAVAAEQLPIVAAHAAHVVVLRLHVLARIPLCTYPEPMLLLQYQHLHFTDLLGAS